MLMEFPDDENTFSMGDQFMLGASLVIKPVVKPDQTSVTVYLPRSSVSCIPYSSKLIINIMYRNGMTTKRSSIRLSHLQGKFQSIRHCKRSPFSFEEATLFLVVRELGVLQL
jgi:hypothetical protein